MAEDGLDLPVLREKRVVGGGKRSTACPHCSSTDRERLIYAFLRDHTPLFQRADPPAKMLHIAPERHLSRVLLQRKGLEYLCIDKREPGYIYANYVQEGDVLNLRFPDNDFDYVLCNHVLEHIPDDRRAMSELRRVLKPGGIGILQVPIALASSTTIEDHSVTDPKERERLFGQPDHVRLYEKQDYRSRLTAAGFKVSTSQIASDKRYSRMLLNREEDLFVVTK
jgi:SAM-dependent methyltransferase